MNYTWFVEWAEMGCWQQVLIIIKMRNCVTSVSQIFVGCSQGRKEMYLTATRCSYWMDTECTWINANSAVDCDAQVAAPFNHLPRTHTGTTRFTETHASRHDEKAFKALAAIDFSLQAKKHKNSQAWTYGGTTASAFTEKYRKKHTYTHKLKDGRSRIYRSDPEINQITKTKASEGKKGTQQLRKLRTGSLIEERECT